MAEGFIFSAQQVTPRLCAKGKYTKKKCYSTSASTNIRIGRAFSA